MPLPAGCVLQLKLDEARAVEEVEARMAAEPPAGAGPGRTVSVNLQLEVGSAVMGWVAVAALAGWLAQLSSGCDGGLAESG